MCSSIGYSDRWKDYKLAFSDFTTKKVSLNLEEALTEVLEESKSKLGEAEKVLTNKNR